MRWERESKRERGDQSEQEEGRVDSAVKEDGFQGGEVGQVKRASLGEVKASMSERVNAKALQNDLQSLGLTPNLDKPEMGKEFGRLGARS